MCRMRYSRGVVTADCDGSSSRQRIVLAPMETMRLVMARTTNLGSAPRSASAVAERSMSRNSKPAQIQVMMNPKTKRRISPRKRPTLSGR